MPIKITLFIFLLTISSQTLGITLKFLKDYNFATGTTFKETTLGGLSGLSYDNKTKVLWSISDDRGNRGLGIKHASRIYKWDFKVNSNSEIQLSLKDVLPLKLQIKKHKSPKTFYPFALDPEGISLTLDSIIISSEGLGPIISPSIMMFDKKGLFKHKLEVPLKYISDAFLNQTIGTSNNAAFESLTTTPDKKHLFTGTEYDLKQDEQWAKEIKTTFVRILKYDLENKTFKPKAEFLYPLHGENGLTDLKALSSTTLLTLERGYNSKLHENTIHIGLAHLAKATNTINVNKIKDIHKVTMAKKELLLDLKTIIPKLNKDHQSLDNIEGMTIGPKLPNGNDTLIVVSDNNFSKKQRTLFIIFEILK